MKTVEQLDATLAIALALCLAGCGVDVESTSAPPTPSKEVYFKRSLSTSIYSIEIEGHEYIIFDGVRKGGIIHSESCPCRNGPPASGNN